MTEDMLGLFERTPRFVKRYDDLATRIGDGGGDICRRGARAGVPDRRPDLSAQSRLSLLVKPIKKAPRFGEPGAAGLTAG